MTIVKIYKCLPHIFFLMALTISKIEKEDFSLSTVGEGQGVQFLNLHYSMACAKIYKVQFLHNIVNMCNSLEEEVGHAVTLYIFKNKLDKTAYFSIQI